MTDECGGTERVMSAVVLSRKADDGIAKFTLDIDAAVEKLESSRKQNRKDLKKVLPEDRNASSNEWYFKCYERLDVHRTMVNDSVRTGTFAMAVGRNYRLFKDKIVLDLGTGTGILSILAAKDGEAKKVIAVDASAMSRGAEMLIKANNLQDKITVVRSRIEDLKVLPGDVDRVDIIMSEWMGYGLFNESMLDSVIQARKRFLKTRGWILPDAAVLKMVGSSCSPKPKLDKEELDKLGFCGEGELPLRLDLLKFIGGNCTVNRTVGRDQVLTSAAELKAVNMYYIQPNEVDVDAHFTITCHTHQIFRSFVFYFDAVFNLPSAWQFSTGPESRPTHWVQTVAALPKEEEFEVWKDTQVDGKVVMHPTQYLEKISGDLRKSTGQHFVKGNNLKDHSDDYISKTGDSTKLREQMRKIYSKRDFQPRLLRKQPTSAAKIRNLAPKDVHNLVTRLRTEERQPKSEEVLLEKLAQKIRKAHPGASWS